MQSRRVLFNGCSGPSEGEIGNNAWLNGDEVTVENCYNWTWLILSDNANWTFTFRNVTFTGGASFASNSAGYNHEPLKGIVFENDTFQRAATFFDFGFQAGPPYKA